MAKKTYERWRVDLKKVPGKDLPEAEKLKCTGTCKITEEQAEVLNYGTLTGYSVAPEMYFPAAETEEPKKEKKTAKTKEVAE